MLAIGGPAGRRVYPSSVVLRLLLLAAVVLVPVLKCPESRFAASELIHISQGVIVTAADALDRHGCPLLPAATAISTAAGHASHAWVIASPVLALAVLAAWATWRPSTRGPPPGRHGCLNSGRDRLLRFCVMRL